MKSDGPGSRGVWYFLAASLALHLIFLLGFEADRFPVLPSAPTSALRGTLAIPEPNVETQLPQVSRSYSRPPVLKQRDGKTDRHTRPLVAESETSAPKVGMTPNYSMSPGTSGDAAIVNAGTQASSPSPQEAISADAVRQYVLLLVPEARRQKRYPPLARERGWEGTVEVTVRLGRMQTEPAAVVTRSSGFPVLDEQALATIGHAARLVQVPFSLRGKDVAIAVPVRFSLQD